MLTLITTGINSNLVEVPLLEVEATIMEHTMMEALTMLLREEEAVAEASMMPDVLMKQNQPLTSKDLSEAEEEVASREVVETSILTTTTRGSKSILLVMISQLEMTQDLSLS